MNQVFLDTSYLLALELGDDQHHQVASRHWRQAKRRLPLLVTTSYVFNETVTYFNSRGYHTKAVTVGNMLLHSPSVRLIHVDEPLFFAGWAYLQQHQDKSYSLTDCISFVAMHNAGLTTAFTFDQHFVQAGFLREPADF